MRKKIVFIILIFSTIFICGKNYTVNASINDDFNSLLIVEKGEGNFKMLLQEGYNVVRQDVEWDKTGTYEVICQSTINYKDYQKTVIVTDKKQLKNGLTHIQKELITDKDEYEYHISDILYVDNHSFYNYGYITKSESQLQMEFIQGYAFIEYYQDNKLQWSKIWDEYSYITSITASPSGVICLMAYYNNYTANLKIIELDKTSKVTKSLNIESESEIKSNAVYYHQGFLYLTLTTASQTGLITSDKVNKTSIVVAKFNYSNFELVKQINLGNDGYNKIIETKLLNNKLYILGRVKGNTGSIYNESNRYHNVCLFIVDLNLELEDYIINAPAVTDTVVDFVINGKKIFFISLTNMGGIRQLKIYEYRYGFKYNFYKATLWRYNEDTYIRDAFVIKQEANSFQIMINAFSYERNLNFCFGLLTYDNCELTNIIKLEQYYPPILLTEQTNDGNIHLCFDDDNKKLHLACFYHCQIQSTNNTSGNDLYKVIFNGYKEVNFLPSKQVFGAYSELVTYQNKSIKTILRNDFYINAYINLEENGIYDLQTPIYANGVMYLNFDVITNGHVIKEVGEYRLRIVGVNNEEKTISFSVEDLRIKHADKLDTKLIIKNEKITKEYIVPNITNNIIKTSSSQKEASSDTAIFIAYDIIIVVTIVAMSIFVTYLIKKHFKNKTLGGFK